MTHHNTQRKRHESLKRKEARKAKHKPCNNFCPMVKDLPEEIVRLIFQFANEDMKNVMDNARVCSQWRSAVVDATREEQAILLQDTKIAFRKSFSTKKLKLIEEFKDRQISCLDEYFEILTSIRDKRLHCEKIEKLDGFLQKLEQKQESLEWYSKLSIPLIISIASLYVMLLDSERRTHQGELWWFVYIYPLAILLTETWKLPFLLLRYYLNKEYHEKTSLSKHISEHFLFFPMNMNCLYNIGLVNYLTNAFSNRFWLMFPFATLVSIIYLTSRSNPVRHDTETIISILTSSTIIALSDSKEDYIILIYVCILISMYPILEIISELKNEWKKENGLFENLIINLLDLRIFHIWFPIISVYFLAMNWIGLYLLCPIAAIYWCFKPATK